MAKQRSKSYSRNKGHAYERKIVKELKDIGFTGVVTSRQESKSADDNKIDIVDTENKLPINIQLKSTQVTPSYFSISKLCSVKNKPFVII